MKQTIPNLEPYCGSWIVSAMLKNGVMKVIGEFYERKNIEKLLAAYPVGTFTVQTAAKYLAKLNT